MLRRRSVELPLYRGYGAGADNADSAEDVLIEAVSLLKLATPAVMTAKEVHAALVQQTQWADLSVSQVKKACSKAGKRDAPKSRTMPAQSSESEPPGLPEVGRYPMFDALEDGHFTEGGQNTWKKSIQQKGIGDRSWQHSGLDKAAMQRFIMAYAPAINGFAANRFAELGKARASSSPRTCIFSCMTSRQRIQATPSGRSARAAGSSTVWLFSCGARRSVCADRERRSQRRSWHLFFGESADPA